MNAIAGTTDLRIDLEVAAPPARLRAAVADVEGWWSTAVDRAGDEATVRFDGNWTRVRIEGERWTVTGQDTPALPVADEWVGDVIAFGVEPAGPGASRLRFVHHGLLAQDCAALCRPAWRNYLASLVALAETGEGTPWRPGMAAEGEAAEHEAPR